jgi:hypothetical protein
MFYLIKALKRQYVFLFKPAKIITRRRTIYNLLKLAPICGILKVLESFASNSNIGVEWLNLFFNVICYKLLFGLILHVMLTFILQCAEVAMFWVITNWWNPGWNCEEIFNGMVVYLFTWYRNISKFSNTNRYRIV